MRNEKLIYIFFILLFTLIINPNPIIIGSFNIYPNDILALILLLRFLFLFGEFKKKLSGYVKTALYLFSVLLVVNVFIGYYLYSKYAFVQFRDHFYTFSALFYFMSISYSKMDIRKILLIFGIFSIALSIIAIGNWIGISFFVNYFGDLSSQISNSNVIKRPLNSEQALFLGSFFIITLNSYINKNITGSMKLIYIIILSGIIFFAQVRSVWVAVIVALISTFIFSQSWQKSRMIKMGLFLLFLIILPFLIDPDLLSKIIINISGSVDEVFQYNSTFEWRVISWVALIKMPKGMEILVGQPFGTSLSRLIGNIETDNSAHSFYVSQYIRSGIIGVISIVSVHIWVLLKSNKLKRNVMNLFDINMLNIISVLMIMYAVYFITYSSTQIYGMILGISFSFIHPFLKSQANN